MRVSFALHGSRGDVQPAIAVAAELARHGHTVQLAVAHDLMPMATRTGLPTRELCPSTADLLAGSIIKKRLRSPNPRTRLKALREVGAYGAHTSQRVMGDLADESDILVTGLLAQERAATIAESRGIAFVPLHYCPVRPNSTVSPTYRRPPTCVRRALWSTVDRLYWLTSRTDDRRLRTELGLPPARGPLGGRLRADGRPEIQVYEAALFPGLSREWGSQRPFTGFLLPDERTRRLLDGNDSRTDGVVAWAEDGQPPVYVGFGSMQVAEERVSGIVDSLVRRGRRVIAHTGHPLPEHDSVLRVTHGLDHERLLPRCRAAVHHGGAGTTAATARAGIPSAIGWLSADQPLWAGALARAGSGTGAPLARLGEAQLDCLLDPATQRAAHRLTALLTPAEIATQRACSAIVGATE
uniref:nucleotide disphospho-sugar-binding domain-containing protein n=1 Tax=Gordonia sp. B7-2 TaxID=3420932 RepID=UPI003D89B3EA